MPQTVFERNILRFFQNPRLKWNGLDLQSQIEGHQEVSPNNLNKFRVFWYPDEFSGHIHIKVYRR